MVILESEYIYEMATVHRDTNENISVAVNPDSKKVGDPYFKFYNSVDFNKSTAVIRIMFNSADYTYHTDGKKLWKLNSKEKKLLVKTLKSESKKYRPFGFTVWDAAKFDWNYEYLQIDIEPEGYISGEYDETFKNNPSYVPSTLKMPNYLDLRF